eukprot:g73351.t1
MPFSSHGARDVQCPYLTHKLNPSRPDIGRTISIVTTILASKWYTQILRSGYLRARERESALWRYGVPCTIFCRGSDKVILIRAKM